jgi:hypothetical protein
MGKVGKVGIPYQIRRMWIKTHIHQTDLWPTVEEYLVQFPGTSKSSMYRDYEVVRVELDDPQRDAILRGQIYGRVEKRVPHLDDSTLIRLFLGMRPKEIKQTTQIEGSVKLEHDITGLLDEYDAIFERMAQRVLPEDDSEEPVDTAHADTEAN